MTEQEQYEHYHKYYMANRERIKARQKAYYQTHKKERNEYRAKYYAENKRLILAKQRIAYRERKENAACESTSPTSGKKQ